MCVVSMIGDHYSKKWETLPIDAFNVSRGEFESLRKEVQEMKELLKKAIKYDESHNQPECQIEEKIELLRKVAKLVGVDLDDVLKK